MWLYLVCLCINAQMCVCVCVTWFIGPSAFFQYAFIYYMFLYSLCIRVYTILLLFTCMCVYVVASVMRDLLIINLQIQYNSQQLLNKHFTDYYNNTSIFADAYNYIMLHPMQLCTYVCMYVCECAYIFLYVCVYLHSVCLNNIST